MASLEEQLQEKYPACDIVETTGKHGGWAKYFRFFEARVRGSSTGFTFTERIPCPGFEHLGNDHRSLEEIEASLTTTV